MTARQKVILLYVDVCATVTDCVSGAACHTTGFGFPSYSMRVLQYHVLRPSCFVCSCVLTMIHMTLVWVTLRQRDERLICCPPLFLPHPLPSPSLSSLLPPSPPFSLPPVLLSLPLSPPLSPSLPIPQKNYCVARVSGATQTAGQVPRNKQSNKQTEVPKSRSFNNIPHDADPCDSMDNGDMDNKWVTTTYTKSS